MFSKKCAVVLSGIALCCSSFFAGTAVYAKDIDISQVKAEIRIGTASLGSTGQVLQAGIAALVSKYLPNLKCSAITTQGSMENVRLMAQKEIEFASINSDASYAAFKGTGAFKKPIVNYQMFSAYSNQCVFVTLKGSGIEKIEDLKGRRVSVGPQGSGAMDLAYSVLKYGYDLWDKIDKVFMSYSDQVEALKDGTIDAMVAHLNSGYPASYFAELDATNKNLHIMGESEEALKRIQSVQPFQMIEKISPSPYLTNLDRDIYAMTNYNATYARPDISEEIVYAYMKTLFDHCTEVDAYHRQGKNIRPELAVRGIFAGMPVHPGAARYYKEKGLWNDSWIIGEIKE